MVNVYRAEFILGLIGSIIGVVSFVLSIVFGIVQNTLYLESFTVASIITAALLLASFILGFSGSFRLRRNDRSGGILLVTAGGLSLIALIVGLYAAWSSFFVLPLFFTGGIMALCRKAYLPQSLQ